jgi:cytochrome c5
VSAEHDKKFFDTFMLVVGILLAITAGLYVLSRSVGAGTQEQQVLNDPFLTAAVLERIQPVRKLAVAGKDNSGLTPAAPAQPMAPAQQAGGSSSGEAASTSAAATAGKGMSGEEAYAAACVVCHGSGVGGAPKIGDAAAWGPRIAQGKAVLHEHALLGYQGTAGFMPAKGGRADLTDQSVIAAVDHMVTNSK